MIAAKIFERAGTMIFVLRRAALFVAIVAAWVLTVGLAYSAAGNIVPMSGFAAGTIVVKTSERRLYYMIDSGHALRFPVGVGRRASVDGPARVVGKFIKPAWKPPGLVRKREQCAALIKVAPPTFPWAPRR